MHMYINDTTKNTHFGLNAMLPCMKSVKYQYMYIAQFNRINLLRFV